MKLGKIILLLIVVTLIASYFAFDLGQYFNLDYIKSQQARIDAWYEANPLKLILIYFVIYILVTGLSLPGAVVMTLLGGAIFGLVWGTVIVSFASSIGATLAFLASRYVLRDWVSNKFGKYLNKVYEGVKKDGAFYLFTLRLVPLFPFFVINLVMGLTPMRTWIFYIVSQIGMLAGTIVFVNAGTQIAGIDSLKGILSPGLLFSFVLLGIFPLIAKKVVNLLPVKRTVE